MACEFCDDYYNDERKHWFYHAESDSIFLSTYSDLYKADGEPVDINAALCVEIDDKIRTRVVNIKNSDYDVYCGRGSKYGNPFIIGINGDRKTVIEKFRNYLNNNKKLQKEVMKLRGLRLGCHCTPLDCHAEVIAEFIESNVLHDFQRNY